MQLDKGPDASEGSKTFQNMDPKKLEEKGGEQFPGRRYLDSIHPAGADKVKRARIPAD